MRSSLIWACNVCADLSVPIFKIITVVFFVTLSLNPPEIKIVELANRVDPDEAAHNI